MQICGGTVYEGIKCKYLREWTHNNYFILEYFCPSFMHSSSCTQGWQGSVEAYSSCHEAKAGLHPGSSQAHKER